VENLSNQKLRSNAKYDALVIAADGVTVPSGRNRKHQRGGCLARLKVTYSLDWENIKPKGETVTRLHQRRLRCLERLTTSNPAYNLKLTDKASVKLPSGVDF